MIQIFPKLFHTGNQICTLKCIVGKNKFIPCIHQEVMFLVHLFMFVFAITPTVTGDYVLMQSISRSDKENSTVQNMAGDACTISL